MDAGSLYDPFFRVIESSSFERSHITDLAAGRSVAVSVPHFLSQSVCTQTLRALESADFDHYGQVRVSPKVMRFGVGVSDHRVAGSLADTYWDALDQHRRGWEALGLPFDPFRECRDGLSADWPHGIEVARRNARELAPGVAREPNQGFLVHFDDALREFTDDLLDTPLVAQFAFNLYLSVAPSGGETVIWRHLWEPTDEKYRLPESYGYAEDVVGTSERIVLEPAVGTAVLLNPRYFHAVRPSVGGRRVALGFAVGMTDSGALVTWG